MNLARVQQIETMARAHYKYKRDPEAEPDRWYSYHEEVLAGRHWEDDCDSLASTVINLMILEGHPLDQCWFAHVDWDRDGIVDHMIAFAIIEGHMYVVGDTFGPVYPIERMEHQLVKFCKVDNIGQWYVGNDPRQLTMV